jgi:hypothetical protein
MMVVCAATRAAILGDDVMRIAAAHPSNSHSARFAGTLRAMTAN